MPFPSVTIGDKELTLPIIQGGMGIGVSMHNLAAAVIREGGIGVIAGALIGFKEKDIAKNPEIADARALKNEISETRALSKDASGLLGINIMVALTNFATLVKTALNEKADIIFSGAGLPLDLPAYLLEASEKAQEKLNTKLAPIVSSARAMSLIAKKWINTYNVAPDLIVIEGPKAGGHLGFKKNELDDHKNNLENILSQSLEAIKPIEDKVGRRIPIFAGGGIYYGEDIKKFLKLGAAGVQMGTRFVGTLECDSSLEFKNQYLNSQEKDLIIIDSPVGMPGRALNSSFLEEVKNNLQKPIKCIYKCLKTCDPETSPYCIALALLNAYKGNFNRGFAFAGKNANKVKEIISVKKLIQNLKEEYELAL